MTVSREMPQYQCHKKVWAYVASSMVASVTARSMLDARPGAVYRVDRLDDVMPLKLARQPSACEGCGAPAVRYSHHCEYCKRPR